MKTETEGLEESGRNKMFIKRLLSGIVLVAAAALMNILGGPVMAVLLMLISVTGLREFYGAIGVSEKNGRMNIFELTGIAGTVIYYAIMILINIKQPADPSVSFAERSAFMNEWIIGGSILLFMVMMSEYVFLFPKYEGKTVMGAFFGFIYIPVMLSFIFLTRETDNGQYLVWLIYIVSWVCDTSAYCVGMLFGKHRLAPVLSPKKSIEGALGGVAGSVLVALLYAWILVKIGLIPNNAIYIFALIGAVGSVVSQIGDLGASAFKRNYDIKDYGNLIPGHGGIMDRFDSVIFSAPMIYILATLFQNAVNRPF